MAAHWQLLTSPLRPSPQDIGLYQQALARWRAECGDPACRVLLLGVTREIRAMDWPEGTELLACDHARAMIGALWPGTTVSAARADPICADWRALPLPNRSRNVAIGDGSASTLASHDELRRMVAELDRVLDDDAIVLLRLYVRPAMAESLDTIAAAARAGRIGSFHAFKWRLAMALHGKSGPGVRLADVHDAFAAMFPDRIALARHSGWSPQSIATIDSYSGANGRYGFHRLDEITAALSPEFEIVSVDYPTYELGERCPIIAARRRA